MTKRELIEAGAKPHMKNGITKKTIETIIGETFTVIGKSIKKTSRFTYPNFGTFTVRKRTARKGRNPQTGAVIKIKASKSVKFKAAPTLKKGL
ncbi:HU family DNA-binding protein [Nitrospira defluvii]|nr:HU family DNA-binding protein [Nitrospira defluvii]